MSEDATNEEDLRKTLVLIKIVSDIKELTNIIINPKYKIF